MWRICWAAPLHYAASVDVEVEKWAFTRHSAKKENIFRKIAVKIVSSFAVFRWWKHKENLREEISNLPNLFTLLFIFSSLFSTSCTCSLSTLAFDTTVKSLHILTYIHSILTFSSEDGEARRMTKFMNIFFVSRVSTLQKEITTSQVEHILSFMHNSPDSHHLILLTSHQSKGERDVRKTDTMNRKINIIKAGTTRRSWRMVECLDVVELDALLESRRMCESMLWENRW